MSSGKFTPIFPETPDLLTTICPVCSFAFAKVRRDKKNRLYLCCLECNTIVHSKSKRYGLIDYLHDYRAFISYVGVEPRELEREFLRHWAGLGIHRQRRKQTEHTDILLWSSCPLCSRPDCAGLRLSTSNVYYLYCTACASYIFPDETNKAILRYLQNRRHSLRYQLWSRADLTNHFQEVTFL